MFLSIIIPVYNCEAYIEDCLLSCLCQDLFADEYEILCINDGSTDSSGEILKKYSDKNSRIKVFTQENRGVSAARNLGLDNAQGEYVMFVDGDDLIRKNILKTLQSIILDKKCNRLTFYAYLGDSESIEKVVDQNPKPNCYYPDWLCLGIFRRRMIEQCQVRFVEGITHGEDVLFVNDFINVCSESVVFPETVYFYRRHGGSAIDYSRLKNRINAVDSYTKIAAIFRDRMFDSEYDKTYVYRFWCTHMFYLMRYLPNLPHRIRCEKLRILKNSKPYLRINKLNRGQIKFSLRGKMRVASMFRHMEIIIYANSMGARLLVARRNLLDSTAARILKHPRRFIKHPVRFVKSTR